jgi:glycosyltransferase involved in cell wall biosynthesis
MPSISIVLPVYDAQPYLDRVLRPIVAAAQRGEIVEAIAVDDSSSDESAEMCRRAGLTVIPSGSRCGPAACRNIGARAATGDVVLFVDADVVIHDDVIGKISEVFENRPYCVAVFGSYDDQPAARGWVSQYRNLLHHYIHQHGRSEASTFWAGCGAVRKREFFEVGGFDATRYPVPLIEDIELGHRLRRRGHRILLVRDIQGTHLKRWTLRGMVVNDVLRRAIPWSRLTLESGQDARDLNLSVLERVRAGVAGLLWISLPVCVWRPEFFWVPPVILVVAWLVSNSFFRLILRRRGVVHMLAALLLHQLYYFYSALSYLYCLAERLVRRRRR